MMCKDCFSGKRKRPSEYVEKLLFFRNIRIAGIKIKTNWLTIDEWLDLSKVENIIYDILKNKR